MLDLSLSTVITGAAFLTSLFSALVAWAAYRHQNPKKIIRASAVLTPLRTSVKSEKLAITFEGKTLSKAYAAAVAISSPGRRDIPSTTFDAGRPLVVDLGGPIAGILASAGTIQFDLNGSEIRIPAQLVKRNAWLELGLIVTSTSGKPSINSPLIDVKAVLQSDLPTRSAKRRTAIVSGIGSIGVAAAVVALVAFGIALSNGANQVISGSSGSWGHTWPDVEPAAEATVAWTRIGIYPRVAPAMSAERADYALPDGAIAPVECETIGEPVTSDVGTSNIWDRLTDGMYLPNVFLETGANGRTPGVPDC